MNDNSIQNGGNRSEIIIVIKKQGGIWMNEFEQDVQSKTNDVADAGAGFLISFLFFALMFIIATAADIIGR